MDVLHVSTTGRVPIKATGNSIGYDLFSSEDIVILPGRRAVVPVGVEIQFHPGMYGRIETRPGLAVKHGVCVISNVVDPSHKGELKVILQNFDQKLPYTIKVGYKIAQLILHPYAVNVETRSQQLSRVITE